MKKILQFAFVFMLLGSLTSCDIKDAHYSAPGAIEQAFPQSQWAQAKHTSWCESRYVFTATNGNHWGIFQIWGGWAPELDKHFWGKDSLGQTIEFWNVKFDPYWNSVYANYIREHYGWSMWQDVCV